MQEMNVEAVESGKNQEALKGSVLLQDLKAPLALPRSSEAP